MQSPASLNWFWYWSVFPGCFRISPLIQNGAFGSWTKSRQRRKTGLALIRRWRIRDRRNGWWKMTLEAWSTGKPFQYLVSLSLFQAVHPRARTAFIRSRPITNVRESKLLDKCEVKPTQRGCSTYPRKFILISLPHLMIWSFIWTWPALEWARCAAEVSMVLLVLLETGGQRGFKAAAGAVLSWIKPGRDSLRAPL